MYRIWSPKLFPVLVKLVGTLYTCFTFQLYDLWYHKDSVLHTVNNISEVTLLLAVIVLFP